VQGRVTAVAEEESMDGTDRYDVMDDADDAAANAAAGECLTTRVAALRGGAAERRHEELMEWAEDLGLERAHAEQIHTLAEEENLLPVYALLLVNCGIGVRELEPPEQDTDEASQQTPPGWIDTGTVELDDVALERRLRATFRRFRSHLETQPDAAAAVAALLAEPDVSAQRLR
jgi:hypothetical protein